MCAFFSIFLPIDSILVDPYFAPIQCCSLFVTSSAAENTTENILIHWHAVPILVLSGWKMYYPWLSFRTFKFCKNSNQWVYFCKIDIEFSFNGKLCLNFSLRLKFAFIIRSRLSRKRLEYNEV